MKNRHLLIAFIFAAIIVIVGAVFKLMHWPGANIALVAGMLAEGVCGFLLILKLFKRKDQNGRGFLDN